MAYRYRLVTSKKPETAYNLVTSGNVEEEGGPFILDVELWEAAEVAANKSYNSLLFWGDARGTRQQSILYTQHITGCIPVAVYCADPQYLGMVHFGACDAGHQETYDSMLKGVPLGKRGTVYAAAAMSDRDSAWFAKSQFESLVLPQLKRLGVPEDNVLFYHDTTQDCMAFGVSPDGSVGTPKSLQKS
jgi:hypothetical protein